MDLREWLPPLASSQKPCLKLFPSIANTCQPLHLCFDKILKTRRQIGAIRKGTQSALGPRWPGFLFSRIEKSTVYLPGLKSNTCRLHLDIRFNLLCVLLDFCFLLKNLFLRIFCSFYSIILLYLVQNIMGLRLCDRKISYKVESNTHVRQLTVFTSAKVKQRNCVYTCFLALPGALLF